MWRGNQTTQAASCLKNAIANQALSGGNNCADSSATKALGGFGPINVGCTHQGANQYICDVTGAGTESGPEERSEMG
jgi:hypothetical protein